MHFVFSRMNVTKNKFPRKYFFLEPKDHILITDLDGDKFNRNIMRVKLF